MSGCKEPERGYEHEQMTDPGEATINCDFWRRPVWLFCVKCWKRTEFIVSLPYVDQDGPMLHCRICARRVPDV